MGSIEPYESAKGRRYRVRYRKPDHRHGAKLGFRTKCGALPGDPNASQAVIGCDHGIRVAVACKNGGHPMAAVPSVFKVSSGSGT